MKKIKNIFIFLVICSMVIALYIGIKTELSPEKVYYGTVHAEAGNWTQESESENVDYTCQIPDGPKDTQWVMMLQSHWTDYEIYVDDQKIYSTLGKRTGAFHLFSLPDGETLHIQFLNENALAVSSIEQSKVWIGDKSSVYMTLIKQNLYAAVFALLAFIMGLVSILAGLYMKPVWHKEIYNSLISLGCYILCAGIWILTDSRLLLLVTQKTGVVEMISFLAFFGLPVPLMEFTGKMFPEKEKILKNFQNIFLLMLLIYSINYIAGILPIVVLLVLEHLLMTAAIIMFLYFGYQEIKRGQNRKLSRVMTGYVVFCICSVFALISFYTGNSYLYSIAYVIGIMGFVFFLADAACISVYEQLKENANAAMYAKLAYLDMMTGLGNRTAFLGDKDLDKTYTGPLAYIMVDANNLKKVNDTLGHQKGDELITQITKCLKQVIKNDGKCYRIGGDEFVISLRNKNQQDIETYITQIQKEIQTADAQSSIPISAAIGYAWTSESHKDLDKLLHEADEAMYENKKKAKVCR